MSISFSYADRRPTIRSKRVLKKFIQDLFSRERIPLGELNVVFCSDEYLLDINRRFLQHDYYTDIITFDLRSSQTEPVSGEIYISVDRVKENAKELNSGYGAELLRVLFHGALHLCGLNDKTKREISLMRQKEEEYLRLYLDQPIRST